MPLFWRANRGDRNGSMWYMQGQL